VWFQKLSIPPPQRVIGNSEGEGGGGSRPKIKESISLKAAGDKLLMNKFIRQNFGGGLTLKNVIS